MFWRLFGTYGVLLIVAISSLGFVIIGRAERHYLKLVEDGLRARVLLVHEVVRDRPAEKMSLLQERIKSLRQQIATRITLIAADGRILADSDEDPASMGNLGARPEIQAAGHGQFGAATRLSQAVNQEMMFVALATGGDSGPVQYVRVALPLDKVAEQTAWLTRAVGTAAVMTAIAALGLALWLARRMSRPLQELTARAEHIAAGQYGKTVYVEGHDEVARLARSFNDMSKRFADQFAQLAEDREQLRMILSGMVEGVVALDAEEHVLFANERAAKLLGFDPQSMAGRKLYEIVRKRSLQDIVRRALSDPEPCQEELDWNGPVAKNLTVHAARLAGTPPRGAVLVLHDTSELRRLERLRQEFVANVSHELKTPLSVIKACVETLLESAADDPAHRKTFLERVSEQAERLHLLILDLLSLARIESGTEAFTLQAVPVETVVRDCLERHRARAHSKNQDLQAEPPDGPEVVAWADEEAVHQILDNMVDNALKYTPPGGRIRVRWSAEAERVCLEVEDSGIGIPAQDLPRIFERFYRVDKARSREMGGTGLGLSIVKHLAQAMNGAVSAKSQPGAGSTFQVTLPRAGQNGFAVSSPNLHISQV
jgi:two-component system phosphate regulon sensor histidine kinase PhoR